MVTPPSQEERGRRFAELHQGPCFLIPNPWDGGTARVLEALGFEALATTSSGFAFTLGRADGEVTLDEVLEHVKVLVEACGLPVSVDLENGYSSSPEGAARAIEAVAAVGAVGGSIEDWEEEAGLYDLDHAAQRIAAAARAARELPFPFMLTARAENHIRGNPDLDDTIARLRAYEEAGADVLYAPGLADAEQIAAVTAAVDRPVNVLARPTLSAAEIAAAGAGR
ncbi:MAG TPA: isocitrate lyase/phosphoenolpyruvate mutase family protein, partial [Solirubrobacterales bacterium]